jgi:hypothetical protein
MAAYGKRLTGFKAVYVKKLNGPDSAWSLWTGTEVRASGKRSKSTFLFF